jgi:hypothetical protein
MIIEICPLAAVGIYPRTVSLITERGCRIHSYRA